MTGTRCKDGCNECCSHFAMLVCYENGFQGQECLVSNCCERRDLKEAKFKQAR